MGINSKLSIAGMLLLLTGMLVGSAQSQTVSEGVRSCPPNLEARLKTPQGCRYEWKDPDCVLPPIPNPFREYRKCVLVCGFELDLKDAARKEASPVGQLRLRRLCE